MTLTERAARRAPRGLVTLARRRMKAARFEPAPCPPPSIAAPGAARRRRGHRARRSPTSRCAIALRDAARDAAAADPHCRIACITVVPPAAALSGDGDENSATGRHIRRLVELRDWAKPLALPEERVTFHVLESDKPAAALVDYVAMNDVGTPHPRRLRRRQRAAAALRRSGRRRSSAAAPCTVTVVRPRAED